MKSAGVEAAAHEAARESRDCRLSFDQHAVRHASLLRGRCRAAVACKGRRRGGPATAARGSARHVARPRCCSEPGGGQQRHVGAADEVVLRQRHDVVAEVLCDDVPRCDARHVGGAAEPHDHLQLVLEHVHH
eukprot:CAMPEP_0117504860 /NCGR_PEP_ID=MMETSP0784-20121206/25069_1 /TAXON_ID=39447 /ORGANISM="" /LENGTH=131 /DNA_ID=CAMNT_0005300233 /DNA_START=70 /DNA_END=462 /DNA_ORIENTATION=-